MKILQINPFQINNNNNRIEQKSSNFTSQFYGIKLKPQLRQDTVSFRAKPPSITAPTVEDLINRTKAPDVLRLNILRLAKYDVPCPVCGHIMLDLDKYNAFEQKIKSTTDPTKRLEYIGELKKYLHPIEAKIFEMMKADNLKDPNMTLHDMLKSRLADSEGKIVSTQTQILADIGILSRNLDKNERINVQNLLNETFDRIIDPRETSRFSRRIFLNKLKNIFIPEHLRANLKLKFISEFELKYRGIEYDTVVNLADYLLKRFAYTMKNWIYTPEQDKIIEKAVKMPRAYNNIDAFIVKYAKRDYKRENPDQQIALRMLQNSLVTPEHIKPESKGGDTEPGNLALMCACDNNRNNSNGVIEQISENPLMPFNYRKYMKRLCQLYRKKIVEKSYITQQNKTYREESFGYLNADLRVLSKSQEKASKLNKDMGKTPTKEERRATRKLKIKYKKKPKKKYKNY